jgi:hypothetical protein
VWQLGFSFRGRTKDIFRNEQLTADGTHSASAMQSMSVTLGLWFSALIAGTRFRVGWGAVVADLPAAGRRSEVIGPMPQIAPKKHWASAVVARWKAALGKTELAVVRIARGGAWSWVTSSILVSRLEGRRPTGRYPV